MTAMGGQRSFTATRIGVTELRRFRWLRQHDLVVALDPEAAPGGWRRVEVGKVRLRTSPRAGGRSRLLSLEIAADRVQIHTHGNERWLYLSGALGIVGRSFISLASRVG